MKASIGLVAIVIPSVGYEYEPCLLAPYKVKPKMAKSMAVKPKKRRGRPATGKDPFYGVRIPNRLIVAIDRWSVENGAASRSDAIRRLIDLGLSSSKTAPKVKN
jgi:hypothetical protein